MSEKDLKFHDVPEIPLPSWKPAQNNQDDICAVSVLHYHLRDRVVVAIQTSYLM